MRGERILPRLMEYAGSYRRLTRASWVLSALSALLGLAPFVFIWKICAAALGGGVLGVGLLLGLVLPHLVPSRKRKDRWMN